jgi:hypothetical protein
VAAVGAALHGDPVDSLLSHLKQLREEARERALDRLRGETRDPSAGARELLDWSECDRLARAGVEIEAHGSTHAILTGVSRDEAERELRSARARLLERDHGRHGLLAYPSGAHDEAVRRIASGVGYRGRRHDRARARAQGERSDGAPARRAARRRLADAGRVPARGPGISVRALRIVLALETSGPGGAENVVVRLARRCASAATTRSSRRSKRGWMTDRAEAARHSGLDRSATPRLRLRVGTAFRAAAAPRARRRAAHARVRDEQRSAAQRPSSRASQRSRRSTAAAGSRIGRGARSPIAYAAPPRRADRRGLGRPCGLPRRRSRDSAQTRSRWSTTGFRCRRRRRGTERAPRAARRAQALAHSRRPVAGRRGRQPLSR